MAAMHPEHITWTALLGKWVQFAQASLALPRDAEGKRWRQSVPCIINLQAVTFALADMEQIAPDDRPLALDKAEILVSQHARSLRDHWGKTEMPPLLRELCDDAVRAMQRARALASCRDS